MLNNKQLLEVLAITKGYKEQEVKELRLTAVKLLSGITGIQREVEEESLMVQLHNLLDL